MALIKLDSVITPRVGQNSFRTLIRQCMKALGKPLLVFGFEGLSVVGSKVGCVAQWPIRRVAINDGPLAPWP